jgi:dihydroflavonol-4-reductase
VKALVTGGTGFVGSHVVRALVEQGHSVRVLHRASSRLDGLEGRPFESSIGDILDLDALRAACSGCDWVFHAAAVADYWRANVKRMSEANVEGTRRVLTAAHDAGVRRVVFTSSAAAVGIRADGIRADETTAFNLSPDRFPYGYSKVMAEVVAMEAAARGQEVVIVNPVVVMGPGDLNKISGEFVLKIKRLGWLVPVTSGGVAVTDVRDVARWHVAAAQQGQVGQRYILGSENIAYPYWYTLIADIVGAPRPRFRIPSALLPLIADGIDALRTLGIQLPVDGNQTRLGGQNIFFDFSKTWNELGTPLIDMRQSVKDTYDWYQAHGYVKEDMISRWVALLGS